MSTIYHYASVSEALLKLREKGFTFDFNQDEEDMIYRVVQESITNAIRHGKAKQIDVNLWKEDKWLNLEIKDNGIGCEEIHTGFGLIHIEERIKMLKGTVEYDGSNGFKVTARIPIRWGEKL